ncbi:hypothetical protein AO903_32845 [Pseudomonas aeruginosa]|uniref:Uncharacterized protein n=1 Tax=Pseudomonas paraeruginosa TaxID=2994495 RepID=A0A2R3J3A8_9PSED|nr:hypothetical protein CSB93_0109 [Pseudomonas paraeruginosa]AWE94378.1 hypothetical protein CSC28_5425 [Pseudomonas paraeruginosa]OPD72896.1 hypothetical protein AO903_32845 [Pseudomonas aeruginosa]
MGRGAPPANVRRPPRALAGPRRFPVPAICLANPRNGATLAAPSLMNLGGFPAFSFGAIAGSVSVASVIGTLHLRT